MTTVGSHISLKEDGMCAKVFSNHHTALLYLQVYKWKKVLVKTDELILVQQKEPNYTKFNSLKISQAPIILYLRNRKDIFHNHFFSKYSLIGNDVGPSSKSLGSDKRLLGTLYPPSFFTIKIVVSRNSLQLKTKESCGGSKDFWV